MYFPSTNYPIDEYKECLALLWALFETYCDSGLIIILGDLNGSLGLMEGSRPCAGPQNERGKLLLEFMENFTLFATNLDCRCTGPLETFSFEDERHKSTVNYIILPKSFSRLIKASSVYLWEPDNLSDHVPVGVTIELTPLLIVLKTHQVQSVISLGNAFHGICILPAKLNLFIQSHLA